MYAYNIIFSVLALPCFFLESRKCIQRQDTKCLLQGSHLASASGDSSVKLWSFEQQQCVATYTDHTQAVWGVAFHDLGDFVASCSLDHSARLWDITTSKCRQSFRYSL